MFLFSVTTEYLVKGLFSLPLSLLLIFSDQNKTDLQEKVAEIFDDYAKFIHHTPFYKYQYLEKIAPMWKTFWNSKNKSFTDIVTLFSFTIEFAVRRLLSFPADYMSNQVLDSAPDVTNIIIKMKGDDSGKSEKDLIEEFKSKIKKIRDSENLDIAIVKINNQEQVFVKTSKEQKQYVYAHLAVPRYEAFKLTADKLVEQNILIKKIAGQDHVQIRIDLNTQSEQEIESVITDLEHELPKGSKILYCYGDSIDSKKRVASLDVDVNNFNGAMKVLNAKREVKVKFVHDF